MEHYKEELEKISLALQDIQHKFIQGKVTRLEYARTMLELAENEAEILAAAYDNGDLVWK